MRVVRNRNDRTITLVHDAYINKIAKKFELAKRTFLPTPLLLEELSKSTGEATKQEIKRY